MSITLYLFGLLFVGPFLYGIYWKTCRNKLKDREIVDLLLVVGIVFWPLAIIAVSASSLGLFVFNMGRHFDYKKLKEAFKESDMGKSD